MKYLYSLPRIKYTFTTGEYTVADIFTRVGFKTNFYANQSLYYEEDNDSVPRPDKLSFIKYENFDHYWMLLYVNKIYDINRDWPEFMENLNDLLAQYSKKSVYYLYEDGEILENDILYLNDSSYGVIESWNPFYKQLVLKENYNLPITGFTDKVFKIRRINIDGTKTYLNNFCGTDSTDFNIFGHQYYLNAPHQITGNSGMILNPFSGITGSNVTEEVYIDTCQSDDKTLFNNTLIYKVVNGQSVNNISIRDKEDELISNYVKKRKLKLIHPAIVAIIDTKTKQMLSNPLITANTLYRTN